MGHGGWTSADILAGAPTLTSLKPTHILFEGGAINDCVDSGGGPAISRAQHILNIQAMVALWRANIPGVDLTIQTMSSVSARQTFRPRSRTTTPTRSPPVRRSASGPWTTTPAGRSRWTPR
jgi:hypothetical protein